MTDSTSPRWVQVDDNNTQGDLVYSGDWFLDSYERPGPYQAPGTLNKGTAHGTNTVGGLSFKYSGQDVIVWGSSSSATLPATAATITCRLDGVLMGNDVVNSGNFEIWQLCKSANIAPGSHELVLNITSDSSFVFWVDTIAYRSTSNPSLEGTDSEVSPNDSKVQYIGAGWASPFDNTGGGDGGRQTNTTGAKMRLPFFGSYVEVRGFQTSTMPRLPSDATYSIDGGPVVPFTIQPYQARFRGLPENRKLFRVNQVVTAPVASGDHTLELTFLGNTSTVPLTVDYFLVGFGGAKSTTDPGVGGGDTAVAAKKTGTGAIIAGGVVGGLAAISIVAAAIWFFRRQRRHEVRPLSLPASARDQDLRQTPFIPLSVVTRDAGNDRSSLQPLLSSVSSTPSGSSTTPTPYPIPGVITPAPSTGSIMSRFTSSTHSTTLVPYPNLPPLSQIPERPPSKLQSMQYPPPPFTPEPVSANSRSSKHSSRFIDASESSVSGSSSQSPPPFDVGPNHPTRAKQRALGTAPALPRTEPEELPGYTLEPR